MQLKENPTPETDPIKIDHAPSAEDLQFLDDRLYEHNSAKSGQDDG